MRVRDGDRALEDHVELLSLVAVAAPQRASLGDEHIEADAAHQQVVHTAARVHHRAHRVFGRLVHGHLPERGRRIVQVVRDLGGWSEEQ